MPQPRISSHAPGLPMASRANIDLGRRLRERKVRGAEAHLHVVDFEERLAEFFQHPLRDAPCAWTSSMTSPSI